MKVTLERLNDSKHFKGITEDGHSLELSGDGNAVGPMQSVLMAAAGCSTIDIVMILEKMRQPLDDIKVEVEGTRREEIPRVYTDIHLHYICYGDLKENKVKQAIDMSLEKYCSVSLMLEKAAKITSSFEIVLAEDS
jgi:putative redox protein